MSKSASSTYLPESNSNVSRKRNQKTKKARPSRVLGSQNTRKSHLTGACRLEEDHMPTYAERVIGNDLAHDDRLYLLYFDRVGKTHNQWRLVKKG